MTRYAEAVGSVQAGGELPAMFAAVYCLRPVLGALFEDASLGMPLAGVIHSEQSLEWRAPVVLGDRIDAEGRIESIQARRGLTRLSLDLRATNQDGREVCTGRSVLLQRGDP